MITIDDMAKRVHKTAVEHGWWKLKVESMKPSSDVNIFDKTADPESRSVAEQLMLMVTELGEAMEEYRQHDVHAIYWVNEQGEKMLYHSKDEALTGAMKGVKPEGYFVELADTVIRIMDSMEANQESLEFFLTMKDAYNKTRPYRHGGKKA